MSQLADGLVQPLGHDLQQPVPHVVAERVVDLLEAVEVEQHQRGVAVAQRLGGALR